MSRAISRCHDMTFWQNSGRAHRELRFYFSLLYVHGVHPPDFPVVQGQVPKPVNSIYKYPSTPASRRYLTEEVLPGTLVTCTIYTCTWSISHLPSVTTCIDSQQYLLVFFYYKPPQPFSSPTQDMTEFPRSSKGPPHHRFRMYSLHWGSCHDCRHPSAQVPSYEHT